MTWTVVVSGNRRYYYGFKEEIIKSERRAIIFIVSPESRNICRFQCRIHDDFIPTEWFDGGVYG